MIRILYSFLCITSFFNNCFSQQFDLYVGMKSPNIAQVEISYELDSMQKIIIGSNYTVAYADELYWSGYSLFTLKHNIFRVLNRSGFGGLIGYEFRTKYNRDVLNRISIEYSNLNSRKYIDDQGLGSGSNTTLYSEFTDTYNNFTFIYGVNKPLSHHISFLLELGYSYRLVERKYSIQGTYNNQQLSHEVETLQRHSPVIRFGLFLKIFEVN